MGMLSREGEPLPYGLGAFMGNSGVVCTNDFAPRKPVAHKLSNFLKPVGAGSRFFEKKLGKKLDPLPSVRRFFVPRRFLTN